MQSADDAAVAELARALDAAILSKDADFAKPLSAGPPVVWVRVGNAGHGKLAAILERSWRALKAGERLVELRA